MKIILKIKKEYKKAFSIVREAIGKVDPYALLEGGAPKDEYDSEVSSILCQLPRNKTYADLSKEVSIIFTSSFGSKFEPEYFDKCAREIFSSLMKQGLVK